MDRLLQTDDVQSLVQSRRLIKNFNVSRRNLGKLRWKFKFCPSFSAFVHLFRVSPFPSSVSARFFCFLSALEAVREHWRRDSNEIFEIQRRCHNRLRLDASAIVEQAFLLLLLLLLVFFLFLRRGIEINFKIEIIRLAIINFSKGSIFDVCIRLVFRFGMRFN